MKHVFFSVGSWEFLLSITWRQRKLQNGDALVFGSIKALVSFSSVWYVCVIDGVVREVPGEVRLAKILLSNGEKICCKEDK
jgi:hypothetical protein